MSQGSIYSLISCIDELLAAYHVPFVLGNGTSFPKSVASVYYDIHMRVCVCICTHAHILEKLWRKKSTSISFYKIPVHTTESTSTEKCNLGNAEGLNQGVYCCKGKCIQTNSGNTEV